MTDVIAEPCTGVKDKACAGDCPAGCIYEASGCPAPTPASALAVAPASPVCPAGAIVCEDDVPGQWAQFTGENAKFSGQLGAPGGAGQDRSLPDDTGHLASYVTSR